MRKIVSIILLLACFIFFHQIANAQQGVVDTMKQQVVIKDTLPPQSFNASDTFSQLKDTLPPIKVDTVKYQQPVDSFKRDAVAKRKDSLPPIESANNDTFFLAKKHGILGKLGKSMSRNDMPTEPVKTANPFLPFAGATINSIEILRLGFERNINDTNVIRRSFGLSIANALHKNTLTKVIANDLLFKTGDRLFPNLMADNERLLREEIYLQDARILVRLVPGSKDKVDVIVITKDVFSIGGAINVSSTKKGIFQFKEENLAGTGSQLRLDALYDKDRVPAFGYGGQYIKRNMKGSFIDWTTGFKTFAPLFNNGRNAGLTIYTGFQKPLVSAYIPWTGALNLSYNQSFNDYPQDTSYAKLYKYRYYDFDGWFGYNFGSKRLLYKNLATRIRKFIAVRGIHQHFTQIPDSITQLPGTLNKMYDPRYANITGVLGAVNVFKQDFYRTNFIYGFGRNEDVPEGFTASLIGGWIHKDSLRRPYFGLDVEYTDFSKHGRYSDYTVRLGGYSNHGLEDFTLLLNYYHFTRLKELGPSWYNRNFLTANITKQMTPILDQQLMLQSGMFGLPYFNTLKFGDPRTIGDFRTTLKGESVFYNMKKYLGFRFAPFGFINAILLKHTDMDFSKSDVYSAVGGGIRTRNENFIFGTIELKGYYFPRTLPGMKNWRVELNSNLQFKFNSTFIKQPDFVMPN